ncbi:hypothetical protein PT974_04722 [Cladobotryum mycophilum]|uniref:NACHT domain-containing protein n=1 Tax=Cladobotryum mycophilum TaxID=491253 RepID=A0ABR0SRF8_9HYPO
MAQQSRGFHLTQVHPNPDTDVTTDIDIIAIHGLDTKSPDTWIWRSKEGNKPDVNWLTDSHMLPSKVGQARILTCDWPADLFVSSDMVQKTDEEFSRRLLDAIKRRDSQGANRPILFIASCLGGVILMKTLVMAQNEYASIKKATRAIVFLATPFQGTSFEEVANWAEPGLRAWASIQGRQITRLLENVKKSFKLDELVRSFTGLYQNPDYSYEVMTFYELGKTNLYHKVFPCLWTGAKQLVDSSSGTLKTVPNPLGLERHHRLMNKFCSPDDDGYSSVVGKIEEFLENIRKGGPDDWIRTKHYTADKLKIERLSGEQLPIKQCYINLAIKAETPDKTLQVELAIIFNKRTGNDNRPIQPRRILIRGRAGVGKTTLCKKIVFDFTNDKWSKVHSAWTELFDRLLWVPLRNLKERLARDAHEYNYKKLFYHEYFFSEGDKRGHRLAEDLWQAMKTDSQKTLFLLDGFDEVSQDFSGDASCFLENLLNQSNVIITLRPNVSLSAGIEPVYLELETVGFYPDQVKDYLEADPKMKLRAVKVQLFLREHWLIQGLVRIPIQLDALCYTWEDLEPGTAPNTMTGMYQAIEQKLWKKDAVRLDKVLEGEARTFFASEIELQVKHKIELLEYLTFNGLCNDVINFSPQNRNKMVKMF